jgi:hypothetical protein
LPVCAEHHATKRRRPELPAIDEVWSELICVPPNRAYFVDGPSHSPLQRSFSCHGQDSSQIIADPIECQVQNPACSSLMQLCPVTGRAEDDSGPSNDAVPLCLLAAARSIQAVTLPAADAAGSQPPARAERAVKRLSLSPATPRPARAGSCPMLVSDASASVPTNVLASGAHYETPSKLHSCSSGDLRTRLFAPIKGSASPSQLMAARRFGDSSSDEEGSPPVWLPHARLAPGLEELDLPHAIREPPGKENVSCTDEQRSANAVTCNLVERFALVECFNHANLADQVDEDVV